MPKKIYPSELRRRVTIKRAIPVITDGGGVDTSEYEVLYTTWAKVTDLTTSQKVYYGLDAFKDNKEVIMRYVEGRDITTDLVVDYIDGQVTTSYSIKSQQMYTQDYKRYQIIIIEGFDVNATK